ncbi:MAG TPA: transketolase C-terminal domain-containing protein [Candidatus Saccharimonadales bacterium]|nr:transketolase C-terminal domain-containing protein [Candidatus Saccharimonadales bacterium]
MLNPSLFLNPKIFDADVEQKPTRDGFGDALVDLGKTNRDVVVLSADLMESTRCEAFAKAYPERFFECGVAEQNMAAIASGLAVSGKVPFISSYATFSPGKNWETIRTTIVYNEANVKIAGHHSGIVTGPDGATHQATEDIAIVRCWPGVTVLVPCDSLEAERATVASSLINGPVYLRFTRDKTPQITTAKTPFLGQAQEFWQANSPVATIFATGHMLYYALLAANKLASQKVDVNVVNIASIKPLDEQGILSAVSKSKHAVVVEDHQIMGGLGGALSEFFARTMPVPMEFIGLQDTFAESGKPVELIKKYGMDDDAIVNAVRKVVAR